MLTEGVDSSLDVRMRQIWETDLPYVLGKWRESWRLAKANRKTPGVDFHMKFDRVVIAGILQEPDTRVIVACDGASPDIILGWVCYTPGVPTLHYVYVRREHPVTKEPLRRRGLGDILVAAAGVRPDGVLVFTCRPREFAHPRGRFLGVEQALLDVAKERGITARFVSADAWLGRSKR